MVTASSRSRRKARPVARGAAPLIAASLLTGLGPGAAQALDPAPTGSVEEVEVLGRRLDAARLSILPALGANLTRFDGAAIAQAPQGRDTRLDRLLLQAPGVTEDGYGQIHVRNEHANVQYRLDGILLPEGTAGFGEVLDLAALDKVRFLTGALPAQYGARTAGVVDLITRTGQAEPNARVSARAGTDGLVERAVDGGGRRGAFGYFGALRVLGGDLGIENPTPARSAIHDGTRQIKGFVKLDEVLDAHWRLVALGGVFDGRFDIPAIPGQAPAFSLAGTAHPDSAKLDQRQRETTDYLALAAQGSWDRLDILVAPRLRASRTRFSPDVAGDLIFNGFADRTALTNLSAGLEADAAFRLDADHTIRAGATIARDRTRARLDSLAFDVGDDGAQTTDAPRAIATRAITRGVSGGLYLQDEWSLGPGLTLNYGLRYDASDVAVREDQWSPRLSLVFSPRAGTSLHLGYARTFTPPPAALVARPDLSAVAGTTKAPAVTTADPPRAEREHYFDIGVTQGLAPGVTLGLDAYHKIKRNLLDDGQFGESLVLSPFNYAEGYAQGVEGSISLERGPFRAYGNLAYGRERARRLVSNQFLFGADELAYIATRWIPTDHDQAWTGSAGIAWRIDNRLGSATLSADLTFGSGMRKDPGDGATRPNGAHVPAHTEIDLGAVEDFSGTDWRRGLSLRVDIVNVADSVFELRDGSGVGVGAPQYGPRRALHAGLSKVF